MIGFRVSGNPSNTNLSLFLNKYPPIKWGKYTPVAVYNEIDNGHKIYAVSRALSTTKRFQPGECLDVRFEGRAVRYLDEAMVRPSSNDSTFADGR